MTNSLNIIKLNIKLTSYLTIKQDEVLQRKTVIRRL